MYACMHACMYVYMYVRVCVYIVHACATRMYVFALTQIHAFMYSCMHVCLHVLLIFNVQTYLSSILNQNLPCWLRICVSSGFRTQQSWSRALHVQPYLTPPPVNISIKLYRKRLHCYLKWFCVSSSFCARVHFHRNHVCQECVFRALSTKCLHASWDWQYMTNFLATSAVLSMYSNWKNMLKRCMYV